MPLSAISDIFSDEIVTESGVLDELQSHPEALRQNCFMGIAAPHCPDPSYWDTAMGFADITIRRYALGGFIRKEFKQYKNSKFDFKLKRVQGKKAIGVAKFKQLGNAELKLWLATWTVLVKMVGRDRALIALAGLINEVNGLFRPYLRLNEPQVVIGGREWLSQFQHENRQLEKIDTDFMPFDRLNTPMSFHFVSRAIQLSDKNDSFQKDWMQVVRARMAIAALLKASNPRSFDRDRKKVSAGRRKKMLDSIAETQS